MWRVMSNPGLLLVICFTLSNSRYNGFLPLRVNARYLFKSIVSSSHSRFLGSNDTVGPTGSSALELRRLPDRGKNIPPSLPMVIQWFHAMDLDRMSPSIELIGLDVTLPVEIVGNCSRIHLIQMREDFLLDENDQRPMDGIRPTIVRETIQRPSVSPFHQGVVLSPVR